MVCQVLVPSGSSGVEDGGVVTDSLRRRQVNHPSYSYAGKTSGYSVVIIPNDITSI